MKLIRSISFSLFMFTTASLALASGSAETTIVINETPAKTVVIKAPAASDVNAFFSSTKVLSFEVYKAGSAEELNSIVNKIQSVAGVETVAKGRITGDYSNINVILKTTKDKAFWINLFKAAGLGHIKINNNAVVEIEKI